MVLRDSRSFAALRRGGKGSYSGDPLTNTFALTGCIKAVIRAADFCHQLVSRTLALQSRNASACGIRLPGRLQPALELLDLLLLRKARDADHASTWKPLQPGELSLTLPVYWHGWMFFRCDARRTIIIEWRPPIVQHGPWPKPTNIYAKRGQARHLEESGGARATLVMDRCAGGDVDIRSVVLEFLESGLVLTMTDRPYPGVQWLRPGLRRHHLHVEHTRRVVLQLPAADCPSSRR